MRIIVVFDFLHTRDPGEPTIALVDFIHAFGIVDGRAEGFITFDTM